MPKLLQKEREMSKFEYCRISCVNQQQGIANDEGYEIHANLCKYLLEDYVQTKNVFEMDTMPNSLCRSEFEAQR